jgi:hypothetical protein
VPITTIDKQSNYFKNNSRSFSLAFNIAALTALTIVTRTLVDDDVSSQAGQGEEHSQDGTLRQKESIVMDEDDGDEDEDEDDGDGDGEGRVDDDENDDEDDEDDDTDDEVPEDPPEKRDPNMQPLTDHNIPSYAQEWASNT